MTDIAHCPADGHKPELLIENDWTYYECPACGEAATGTCEAEARGHWTQHVLSDLAAQERELFMCSIRRHEDIPVQMVREIILQRHIWLGQNPLVLP